MSIAPSHFYAKQLDPHESLSLGYCGVFIHKGLSVDNRLRKLDITVNKIYFHFSDQATANIFKIKIQKAGCPIAGEGENRDSRMYEVVLRNIPENYPAIGSLLTDILNGSTFKTQKTRDEFSSFAQQFCGGGNMMEVPAAKGRENCTIS